MESRDRVSRIGLITSCRLTLQCLGQSNEPPDCWGVYVAILETPWSVKSSQPGQVSEEVSLAFARALALARHFPTIVEPG